MGEDEGLWRWRVYFIKAWHVITSSWCYVKCCFTKSSSNERGLEEGRGQLPVDEEEVPKTDTDEESDSAMLIKSSKSDKIFNQKDPYSYVLQLECTIPGYIGHKDMNDEAKGWLEEQDLGQVRHV